MTSVVKALHDMEGEHIGANKIKVSDYTKMVFLNVQLWVKVVFTNILHVQFQLKCVCKLSYI